MSAEIHSRERSERKHFWRSWGDLRKLFNKPPTKQDVHVYLKQADVIAEFNPSKPQLRPQQTPEIRGRFFIPR